MAGILLMLLSHLGWIIPVFLLPALDVSWKIKGVLLTLCLIYGNVTYNLGMVLVGADLVRRLKQKQINLQWLWVQIGVLVRMIKKHLSRKDYRSPGG